MLQKANLEPISSPWSISGGCCPPSRENPLTWLDKWSWKAEKHFFHIMLILKNKEKKKSCMGELGITALLLWKLTAVGGTHISCASWSDRRVLLGFWDGWGCGRAGRMEMRAIIKHFLLLSCVIVRNPLAENSVPQRGEIVCAYLEVPFPPGW